MTHVISSANVVVGGTGLPPDVQQKLGDLITQLALTYEFKHGATAAMFHVAATLAEHLNPTHTQP